MRLDRLFVLGLLVAVVATAGCSKQVEEPAMEPKIAPPVIAEAGVLRVGVDLEYPPFAGKDGGVEAGLDVDIAAALAERLGLKLELVDVGEDGAAAIDAGDVDIALGAMPITDAVLADVTFAGSYLVDGPAFFSFVESASADASVIPATVDPATLGSLRVAAQEGSTAYWSLESEYGEGFTMSFATLAEAFEALASGQVDVVVGDAAVGAYIALDHDGVGYAGQYGPGTPVGVALAKDATALEEAIRETLDALAAEGILDTIRSKWLGDLPELQATTAAD